MSDFLYLLENWDKWKVSEVNKEFNYCVFERPYDNLPSVSNHILFDKTNGFIADRAEIIGKNKWTVVTDITHHHLYDVSQHKILMKDFVGIRLNRINNIRVIYDSEGNEIVIDD